jgi:hypothetical protein
LKRLKDPMWVKMAGMAIRIALLIVTRLERSYLAMSLKGVPAQAVPFMAVRFSRPLPRYSVGIALGEFSHVLGQVPLGEQEERGMYVQTWGKLVRWMFASIVSSERSAAVWFANVWVATVVARLLTSAATTFFACLAVG